MARRSTPGRGLTSHQLKQFPAADGGGLWTHFTSVDATDASTVVIKFDKPAPTLLPTIEGTYIVPQHLWATVGDPSKYTNTNPVGTGPMKLSSFNAQVIKYVKNPNYWQADKVKVEEMDYPVLDINATALLKMASSGRLTASRSGCAVLLVQKDSAHNSPIRFRVVPAQIVPNLKNPTRPAVAQAISAARPPTDVRFW
jgi:peptide/nickel transport system substrate-binding protein